MPEGRRWRGDAGADPWREVRGGKPAPKSPEAPSETQADCQPTKEDDHWLGRISLFFVPHPTIANLYHCGFDYTEPWQWSRETESVKTGRWVLTDRRVI